MTFVLIDNYDSFTYNLYHYMNDLGVNVEVIRNDAATPQEIAERGPLGVVLSPGPCTPNEAGICLDVIRQLGDKTPILGVCLGHQAIGQAFGGRVVRAPQVMHGKVSQVQHAGRSVFEGLPNPFEATRYHSLIVARDSVPDNLEITAESPDGLIMGLAHKTQPLHGVQFHPESIASEYGHALLKNFIGLCAPGEA